jgi:hypothetical protein
MARAKAGKVGRRQAAGIEVPRRLRVPRSPSRKQSRRARARLELVLLPGGLGLGVLISLLAFAGAGEKAAAVQAGQPSLQPSASTPAIEQVAARELARDQAARRRMAPTLQRARGIAREVETRHRPAARTRFDVTDVSLTLVVASVELGASGSQPARSIPADNGVHFTVCPAGTAMCAGPGRGVSRRASSAAGRVGLELALRTFLETPATLVVVSLPRAKGRPTALVFERSFLRGIDAQALLRQLGEDATAGDRLDRVARAHVVALTGLASYSHTRDSLLALPVPVAVTSRSPVRWDCDRRSCYKSAYSSHLTGARSSADRRLRSAS